MVIWEVIIYEANGIWNWKANEKHPNCKTPVFGKTFNNKKETIINFEKYADLNNIKKWGYVKENKMEVENGNKK